MGKNKHEGKVRHCDDLREAMDFAQGKAPLRFFSGYCADDYTEISETDAAQLAEDNPDAHFIGSRPRGARPGEVVIQPRLDPDADSMAYLRRD